MRLLHRGCLLLILPVLIATLSCSNGQTLTSIQVTPATFDVIGLGGKIQFTALGTFQRPKEVKDITSRVTWSTPVVGVATVTSTGLATSVGLCGSTPVVASAHNDLDSGTPDGAIITGSAQFSVHNPNDPLCPVK